MIPADISIFLNDPWWIVLIKVVGVVVLLLTWTIFNVWFERRLVAKMQHRLGPIMNPIWLGGLGQALGDGLKLMFKEDFAPGMVDRVLYTIAPILAGVCAFGAWSVIPLGGEVNMFGVTTRLQVTDMPVSALLLLAMSSVAIYGFVLAGWSSNSPYSLLGSLRSSAQMISYEISMGLCYVAVFLYAGSMSTSEIVEAQGANFNLPFVGEALGLQQWYWFLLFPSFVIFLISMVGETNRAPFDLPECESELVSGHLTEYTGFRYAIFFLAEYINMATVSAVATTLFLGGYKAIWPIDPIVNAISSALGGPAVDMSAGYWGFLWFFIKVQLLISMFVWLRGTLPRLRYDQFMALGWKVLIPVALGWVMIIALLRGLMNHGLINTQMLVIAAGAILMLLVVVWALSGRGEKQIIEEREEAPFDAFAGGFPVPPMPGQTLPEFAGVVVGTSTPTTDEPGALASDDQTKDGV